MSQEIADHVPANFEPFQETTIVDTDVHLTFNATIRDLVAERMDEPYASYTHSKTPDAYPSAGWAKSLGGKRPFHTIDVTSPAAIQEPLCEGLGVDYPIINTSAPIDKIVNTQRAVEEMRAVNDVLIEEFLDQHDHFRGLASVSTRTPDRSAEELDRLGDEDQIVGAYLYQGEYMKPLGDPSHDVLYRAMEDNGLTPVYHVSHFNDEAPVLRQLEKNFSWHVLGPVWGGMLAVTSLIAQGVPEKFPDLDFVILEADLGAVPLLMARMNREYAQWKSELPLLDRSPEEYIRDAFYFATQPTGEFENSVNMTKLLDIIGADSIIFSSDHPHYDFDTPSRVEAFLGNFSAEEREQILHGNAARVFDIDING